METVHLRERVFASGRPATSKVWSLRDARPPNSSGEWGGFPGAARRSFSVNT